MTGLRSVAARIARTVRCIAIAYIAVQVIIWHSFYAADPWRLAGPAVAIAWGAAAVAYLRRRWPAWQLVGIDSGVYVVLALTAGWCVPAAIRGDAANWLFIAMQSQLIVAAWFAPGVVSAVLAVVSGAAYWAGAELGPAGSGGNSPAAAAVLLIAIAAAHQCGRRMFYRRAAGADRALAQADADAREQYVRLSRKIERREHERLLHDTVLNTLTALARAGNADAGSADPGSADPGSADPGSADPGSADPGSAGGGSAAARSAAAGSTDAGEVVGRCRHDVTLMEFVLGDPGDPAKAAGRAYGGLVAAIEALAVEMRARGLDVHVTVASGAPGAGVDAPVVPVPVAVAIVRAVREALANVISHAGTAEAWVGVSPAAPGAGTAASGGVRVTVRDAGTGFDPASVDPARLGLRRSITERIADWGGRASIRSAPGHGTEVSLYWPGPVQPGPVQSSPVQSGAGQPAPGQSAPGSASPASASARRWPAPHRRAGGPDMVSGSRPTAGPQQPELPRAASTLAVIWQFAILILVLADLHDYRQPAVPVAVWLGMLAAAVWLVPRARADGLNGADAAIAIVVAVAAVILVGWDRRMNGVTGTVDWSVLGTGWLLALVALSRSAWVCVSGALLVFAAHAFFTIRLLGVTPLGLARLAVTGVRAGGDPGHLRRPAADPAYPCRAGRAPRRPGQPVSGGTRGHGRGPGRPAQAACPAGSRCAAAAARHRRRDARPCRQRGAGTLRRACGDVAACPGGPGAERGLAAGRA